MAPSSAQTSPSQMAMKAPSTQPSIACGPPIAMTTRGKVMNGPTPIMFIMLSERALPKLTCRVRATGDCAAVGLVEFPEEFCMKQALEESGNAWKRRRIRGRAAQLVRL